MSSGDVHVDVSGGEDWRRLRRLLFKVGRPRGLLRLHQQFQRGGRLHLIQMKELLQVATSFNMLIIFSFLWW